METLKDVLQHLIFPWLFMSISARRIPYTIRTLISEGRWQTLFCLDGFCDALFGNFWAVVGPQVKSSAEVRVIPLLEGRVRNAKVSDHVVGKPVSGRILEIGAGTAERLGAGSSHRPIMTQLLVRRARATIVKIRKAFK